MIEWSLFLLKPMLPSPNIPIVEFCMAFFGNKIFDSRRKVNYNKNILQDPANQYNESRGGRLLE